jgi:xanthine dehydrogenase accessory factor
MHAELLRMASELAGREEPFVLAVVVRRQPASSAQAGDMALITAAGEFHGWLGGSCTQPTVVREARRALADGRPRLLALSPDPEAERRPGVAVFPMTCHSGGSVEIYLDPILPATRLLIFGASPIARALATLGRAMGYSVAARAAGGGEGEAEDEGAVGGEVASASAAASAAAAAADPARPGCYVVVATMGDRDAEAIRAALALRPAYLGVVASARRFAQVRESLLAQGVAAAALDSIRSPAGVAIGAQEPAEIAVSVLAEIVAHRHAAAEAPGTPGGEEAAETETAEAEAAGAAAAGTPGVGEAAAGQAIDPICGMTVETAGSRHTAEAGGRTWHFCGEGCRRRFLAAPERFAAARESAAPQPAAPQPAALRPAAPRGPRRSAGGA